MVLSKEKDCYGMKLTRKPEKQGADSFIQAETQVTEADGEN